MGENCHDHDTPEIPGYWHSMDSNPSQYTGDKFSAGQLSISTPPFKNQLDSIRTRIMQGATNVELGFTGTGKGTGQNLTPGTLGIPERIAIKEIAKINDVGINSVHSAMSIQGLAGFSQNQFSEEKRATDIEEVKRTIDFASDVTDGGAIVVHTGEFPYSVKRKYGDKLFTTKDGKKIELSEELGRAETYPILFVDKYDGNVSGGVRPNWTSFSFDEKGKEHTINLDDMEKLAKFNLEKYSDKNFIEKSIDTFGKHLSDKRKKEIYENKEGYEKTLGNKYWLAQAHDLDISSKESEARREEYTLRVNEAADRLTKLHSDIEARKKIKKNIPKNRFIPHDISEVKISELEEDYKKLSYQQKLDEMHRQSYTLAQAEKEKKIFDMIPIEDYGKQQTSKSIAELAIHAQKMTKEKNLKKPLFVAPENLWGGEYGAHPEDLKQIINNARSQFVKNVTDNKTMSENEAKIAAKDHIKATFDIGHANIWRKYFGGNDNEFKQWLGNEVNKLTKEGIIGHVHVSDNFGYNDEHLPPGYGNAPIKEFMTHLEKGKYKGEIIIEPGHHDIQSYNLGMKHLETPIYRIHNKTSTWTDVAGSYFGKSHTYGYITPQYLPSQDKNQAFTWSELPLE